MYEKATRDIDGICSFVCDISPLSPPSLVCAPNGASSTLEAQGKASRDLVNSELAPAPKVDRVGFPKDYRTRFKFLGVPMRTNTAPSVVMTAYGNDLAASVTNAAQLPYPNGSIIVMEFAKTLVDSEGKPLLDANDQRLRGEVIHVDVMRRGEGFGEAYETNRSGQWEFAGYLLDGSYSTPPGKTASCAQCHQKAGVAKDFVFPLRLSTGATATAIFQIDGGLLPSRK